MQRVADVLERAYGTPDLGNLADPLDEAIYIILTYQTDVGRARQVWSALKCRFPRWQDVLDAPERELCELLRPSGFHRARAKMIRELLTVVAARWGGLSLDALRPLTTSEAESALRALPGLDIKGARCILMYALGRKVFPVDSNTYRFMQRFGVVRSTARYRRSGTHEALQAIVRPADRYRLHVNLVVHGQRICLPRSPRCEECPLRHSCAGRAF